MKKYTVGLLGAPINNGNMGCLALTYSLISLLEDIASKNNIIFNYINFEGVKNEQSILLLCEKLNLCRKKIESHNIYPVESLLGLLHRPLVAPKTIYAMKKCTFFIDLTQGDSFTDIYGNSVFNKNVNGKLLVKKLGKPLILGPQTYGPYNKKRNEKKAKKAIEKADLVISRDNKSKKCISSFSNSHVYTTTDLAFALPFKKIENDSSTIKVGVNISGLLVSQKKEKTPIKYKLKADYDDYINKLIKWLIEKKYEIYIIPHVIDDDKIDIALKYSNDINFIKMYNDPISVKNQIAQMDIFIGARMHATIGALSSDVASIPCAYSRKFNGLYESLNYPYVIDLLNDSTDVCIEKTKQYVLDYKVLRNKGKQAMKEVIYKTNLTKDLLERYLKKIELDERY